MDNLARAPGRHHIVLQTKAVSGCDSLAQLQTQASFRPGDGRSCDELASAEYRLGAGRPQLPGRRWRLTPFWDGCCGSGEVAGSLRGIDTRDRANT